MSFKGDLPEDGIMAEINMTPLIDVVLVLLIIFMVTSTISLDSGLDVNLPTGRGKSSAADASSAVILTLLQDGQAAVQGRRTPLTELKGAIAQALEREKTELVVLEGDRKARLGLAVQLMELAREAGAKRFAIAADRAD